MHNNKKFDIKHFFNQHYDALCLFATHVVGDIDEAEDIVMDCFAEFVSKAEEGWVPDHPRSYIYMMVRNACLDRVKKQVETMGMDEIDDVAADDEDTVARCEKEAEIWRVIDGLPMSCRRVFLMSKQDGMKYSEIAEALSISVKTVEAHISKAYSVLRKYLPLNKS